MDRFWSKVNKTNSCWLWTAGVAGAEGKKYGYFWLDGRMQRAHRVSWWLTFAEWPGLLMHTCDQMLCVRPDHLSVGSALENNQDMMSKGRYGYGRRKLSWAQVDEIRARRATGEPAKQIAPDYGVTTGTVYDVCGRDRVWA